jgi:hypothetical protein
MNLPFREPPPMRRFVNLTKKSEKQCKTICASDLRD